MCWRSKSRTADLRSSTGTSASPAPAIRPGGKSSGVRIVAVAEDDGAFEGVVQLADVPLPGGGHQAPDRRVVHAVDALAQASGVPGQEDVDELGDVLATVAQRGQVDRDDVEPVVQVGAEPAGGDLRREVLVRRRHDPGRDADRPGGADGQHLLGLDGPEELRLGGQRELADLVEEDRPAPRRDEQAGVVAVGAGERAPDVAEELVLQQVVRDRRAVDRQERRVGLGPGRVQGAGHQLLARARLARDQHVAARRADLADQGLDRPASAALWPTRVSRPTCACSCRRSAWFSQQEPAIAHQPVDLGEQLLEDHRLHQVVVRPALEGRDGVLDRGVGGDHQDQGLGPDLEQAVEQFEAVGAGQLDVAEGQVGLEPLGEGQGRGGVAGHADLVALPLEELLEGRGDHLLVVDDEDAPRGLRRPRAARGRGESAAVLIARLPSRLRPRRRAPGRASAARGSGRSAGSRTVNVDPRPGSVRYESVPPSSSTICRLTNRPSPVPCGLVVKNGWNSRQRSATEIPRPSSSTLSSTQPAFGAAFQVDPPPVARGVDRVEDEVEDDLRQVVADGADRGEVGVDGRRDRPLLGPLVVLGDPQGLVDHLGRVDARDGGRGGAREVDQLADRPLDPAELAVGELELLGTCTGRARAAGASGRAS